MTNSNNGGIGDGGIGGGDETEVKAMVNAGLNTWLATLPLDDDWGDTYKNSIPIRWDEEKKEWVEDDGE